MRVNETVVHAADPRRVFEMLSDQRYNELRAERTGATDQTVVVETDGDATTVTTRRHLPSRGVPDFAKAFVGPTLLLVETVRWGRPDADGEREGAMSLELPGLPISFTGGVHLRNGREAGTTEHVIDGDLEVRIPFMGHRIEQAVATQVEQIVRLERSVAQEWLATH